MSSAGRRAELSPDESVRYAPITPLAIVGLGIAVLTALAVGGLWLAARQSGKPVYQPLFLIPAIVGMVCGLIALHQLRSAEGTLSGRGMATATVWVAGLTVLVYGAYLVAVDLAIRNQSSQFVLAWIAKAATGSQEAAFLSCLEPAPRMNIDENDVAGIRARFGGELGSFGNNDTYRLFVRAGEDYDAKLRGVREWDTAEGGYQVHQVIEFRSPEGKFELYIPTTGRDLPGHGGRGWQINARKANPVTRELTAFGRLIADIQIEARKHLAEWSRSLSMGNYREAHDEMLPLKARVPNPNRQNLKEQADFDIGSLIRVDGKPPTDEQRKQYAADLLKPTGLNVYPGSATNPVGAPKVEFTKDGVRLVHQVEINRPEGNPTVAHLTTEVQGDELIAELLRARFDKNWRNAPTAADRPGAAEIDRFPNRGFRVIDINVLPSHRRLSQPIGPQSQ